MTENEARLSKLARFGYSSKRTPSCSDCRHSTMTHYSKCQRLYCTRIHVMVNKNGICNEHKVNSQTDSNG